MAETRQIEQYAINIKNLVILQLVLLLQYKPKLIF